jgi:hypothetical protein
MDRRRRSLTLFSVAAVAGLALIAAGCGSSRTSAGVANVATTTATTTTQQSGAVAFARCLRAHGLPNWPDPARNGVFDKSRLQALGYGKSQVRAAEVPCGHLLPSVGPGPQQDQPTRAQLADELSFAHCMRSHGLARFPDPGARGGLTVEMVEAQGIDVHSPAVLRVVQTCLPASHGWLTARKVRQALAHAGH